MGDFNPIDDENRFDLSEEHYAQLWADDQGLSAEELNELKQVELIYSGDLKEATYSQPFEVLDANCEEVFDVVMADFRPYTTFREVWLTHERHIIMEQLVAKGYWSGEDVIATRNGAFMGDGLSFIHLVLWLVGAVRAVHIARNEKRPLGQNIGDDLIALATSLGFSLNFCQLMEGLGAKFSKLNSICEDAGTFCESYFAKVSNEETLGALGAYNDSKFGDVFFLDIIKGSLLGGQTKVRMSGADSFLGHANMLSKQIAWHPSNLVKLRAPRFLWAVHYESATKLTSAMVTLPITLGGMSLAIREPITESHPWWIANQGYYETMLHQPLREFLKYQTLLRGIFLANPKGQSWSNDLEKISSICENVRMYTEAQMAELSPAFVPDLGFRERVSWIKENLNMIMMFQLPEYLARQESFLKQWNMKDQAEPINCTARGVKGREMYAWGKIKTDLYPMEPNEFRYRTIKQIEREFRLKAGGLWISKDDPAIEEALSFMPSLFID